MNATALFVRVNDIDKTRDSLSNLLDTLSKDEAKKVHKELRRLGRERSKCIRALRRLGEL